ncbi:MAG: Hsp20/alpha crystallin family protein [Planctomycetes bacterium]|nr:Hsp20/alpha crystallin family protein [Planctomycetota bacterium]
MPTSIRNNQEVAMKMLTPFRRRNLGLTETNPFDQWMREFFDNGTHADNRLETRFLPVANIAETDKEWVVSMELPGMNEKEVDVRLNGNQLVVTGERKQEKETKDKQFHRVESSYGMFERRFDLPGEVRTDGEGVVATFHNGMLEVRVGKLQPKPTTKIPVKST